jgi:hypothetical protein
VYLAIVTILTMIIFVFQFGAGDPFTRVQQWIGMSVHHGDKVVELYGKTIYTEDLDKLRWQRQAASEFLQFGTRAGPLAKSLEEIRKQAERDKNNEKENFGPVQTALRTLDEAFNPMMMRFSTPERLHQQILNGLERIQFQFNDPAVQNNESQLRALDTIATVLAFDAWNSNPNKPAQEYYFGGTPKTADLLDFLVWKHEADKLGIVLNQADVCREINHAWGNGDFLKTEGKFESNEWVGNFLGGNTKIHKSLTSADLLKALTDEYRVAMAKKILLGSDSGVRGYRNAYDGIHFSPAAATPDEFYKYFQDQRTTVAVSMLPIEVKSFVEKVQAKPSEADLRNLYARYKDEEPSPTRRAPGFKEPRRIKVQYFSFRTEGPFARKLAAKATELLPVFRVTAPAAPLAAGGGLAWGANLATLALATDPEPAIRALYDDYRREQAGRALKHDKDDGNTITSLSRFGQGFDPLDRHAAQAQPPAATVGTLLGHAGTGGTPLAAPITWMATNELYERATVTLFASTVLAGSSSSPFTAATLVTRYLYAAQPLEAVRDQMLERFQTNLARRMMESNIRNVRKEIEKLLASHSDEKLNEFLKKAVEENGLENVRSMSKLQTRQEMLDAPDPALKELRAAYEQSQEDPFNRFAFFNQQTPRPDFVSAMFHTFELSQLEKQMKEEIANSKQFLTRSGEEGWVFWRSEDRKAKVREFNDIKAEVRDAWYFEQARKLARDEARRIHEELKKQSLSPSDAVKFLREQKHGQVFELSNVAHLVARVNFLQGHKFTAADFRPYEVPKQDIAHPPADLVDQLLKLKEPGESLVIADQPVRHYYVAVLMEKPQIPERREFYEVYSSRGQDNIIWNQMMAARQRKYVDKMLEQMRAEATKNLENGEYVYLSDNVRNRADSFGDSE